MSDAKDLTRRTLDPDSRQDLIALINGRRWAALASLSDDGAPLASSVAYALSPGRDGFVLHLSRLAEHTGNLLARPSAGLLVSVPDTGDGDPQTLARLSVQGQAVIYDKRAPDFSLARAAYLKQLPHAAPRFEFTDFELFLLRPERAHFVGGFARAFRFDEAEFADVLTACAPG